MDDDTKLSIGIILKNQQNGAKCCVWDMPLDPEIHRQSSVLQKQQECRKPSLMMDAAQHMLDQKGEREPAFPLKELHALLKCWEQT